jgi:transitional endoplasmic reticulum ATPase
MLQALLSYPDLQNLQQSRGFGNNFKFSDGDPTANSAPTATSGNAGFADDMQDDNLYA